MLSPVKESTAALRYTKEEIVINGCYPEQKASIGKQLQEGSKTGLRDLLKANANVFAWTDEDEGGTPNITGVNNRPF